MADIFNLTDTWNAGGTTFSGIKMNITNTASATASKPLDIQVGGVSYLATGIDGDLTVNQQTANLSTQPLKVKYQNTVKFAVDYLGSVLAFNDLEFQSGTVKINWAGNVHLYGPANTLQQRVGTSAQSFQVYNTYTDAANYERGVLDWSTTANTLTIGTQKAGTGAARPVMVKGADGAGAYALTLNGGNTAGDYLKMEAAGGLDLFAASQHICRVGGGTLGMGANSMSFSTTGIGFADVGLKALLPGVLEVNNGTGGVGAALKVGTLRRNPPVTKTADFTVADTDSYLILNKGSAGVVTLPAAASYVGREITFTNIQAFAWTSASANVVPRIGGTAATPMLAATDGAWCTLVSDGTSWINLKGTP